VYKQGGCSQELLELQEHCFALISEPEGCILVHKLVQGLSNVSVVLDEPPIEVTEP
jgi:hypothetical protein